MAEREEVSATVLAKLRFEAPDQPPHVQVYTQPIAGARLEQRRMLERFATAAEASARDIRLPCHSGAALDTVVTYLFRMEDSAPNGFKPGLVLTALLPFVQGISQQRLAFDTSSMDCPFDVALVYRRPSMPNAVAEVGSTNAARRPMLEWLEQVEFDLPAATLSAIYGDTARFTVPCLKIDLNPTGASS